MDYFQSKQINFTQDEVEEIYHILNFIAVAFIEEQLAKRDGNSIGV